jgi:hypothetical protein
MEENGILLYRNKFCVPNCHELRNLVQKRDAQCALCGIPRVLEKNCNVEKIVYLAKYE